MQIHKRTGKKSKEWNITREYINTTWIINILDAKRVDSL
jgi:hypothetical protein